MQCFQPGDFNRKDGHGKTPFIKATQLCVTAKELNRNTLTQQGGVWKKSSLTTQ
jgi:hypothetical protein